jgi:DNA polymerase IV
MASSPMTLLRSSSPTAPLQPVDFSSLPPIYVLPAHLTTDELHDIEDQIQDHHGDLTYDIAEARLVLGKIGTKKRAELELRTRKLWTEEIIRSDSTVLSTNKHVLEETDAPRKRLRTSVKDDGSTTEDENEERQKRPYNLSTKLSKNYSGLDHDITITIGRTAELIDLTQDESKGHPASDPSDNVKVIKLDWLRYCLLEGRVLDTTPYLVYEGCPKMRPQAPSTPPRPAVVIKTSPRDAPKSQHVLAERPTGSEILERARADAGYAPNYSQDAHYVAAPHGSRRMGKPGSGGRPGLHHAYAPKQIHLMEMTTEEYEGTSDHEMPPPPDWVEQRIIYACQRVTPANPPNDLFIGELKKIRLARILTNDEIGVRAYSTSIASLAAYPYKIVNPREILRLPGCDVKIANLWIEWKNNNGKVQAAEEAQNDPALKIVNLFYEIWGVGATTAREFYYDKGWNDLDDVVEYGWGTLSRVQQIGVKFYDEFQQKIPRSEVEFIADKVREHAIKVRDDGIELIVVGGYRRGKKESGDVDMIVSHRRLDKTAGLVQDIVESLEQEGWITHTLTLSLKNTHRNQSTLPFKTSKESHGTGFDTLDKALVVWQDPVWPTKEADIKANSKAKNPNIHRRVDIIISPWRTVGCAVTGWTSGTTFQRDLRRYARRIKGWKFDSSGIRDRSTGDLVELEGPEGVSGSMIDAEKRVFEGFGLEYREPWERCTN